MQARTQFPPEPRSAAEARHWVRDHLTEIGRSDLVPAAEAGVSELVTNGILHAQTSIGLQLTRNRERIVIEVYDGSPLVQQPAVDAAPSTTVDSTIGRGLRIVRAYAREWGVSTTKHGKAVWFQPAPANGTADNVRAAPRQEPEDGEQSDIAHPTLDLDAAIDALADAFPDTASGPDEPAPQGREEAADGLEKVEVRLLGVPPWLVRHYRKRWLELVREMHLVALAEPSPQQRTAQRFCAAAHAVHGDLYVIEKSTLDRTPAVSDDGAAVDAVFEVRRSRRDAFVRVREMAREMEKSWTGTELLFVHPGQQAVQLREWWLGEFIGQIDGAEPTPWTGEMRLRDEAMLTEGSED
jgi:anti-sigma regulatory factor (Ser/Thr protein kinase)